MRSPTDYASVGYKTSETYYDVYLGKGDEIADRSFNFTSTGTLKSKSIFEYGTAGIADGLSGSEAWETANSEDVMVRSVSYKMIDNDLVDTPGYQTIEYDDVGYKTSETYYDVHLGKGDEIADRSFNFTSTCTLKTKSVFEYGAAGIIDGASGSEAWETANSEDVMVRSVSYKMTSPTDYASVGYKTSETYYDVHLGKGDEIADRSFNFTSTGTLKSKSVFEYGAAGIIDGASGSEAWETANSEDVMVRSVSYKMTSPTDYASVGYKTSETYYDDHLGKGD